MAEEQTVTVRPSENVLNFRRRILQASHAAAATLGAAPTVQDVIAQEIATAIDHVYHKYTGDMIVLRTHMITVLKIRHDDNGDVATD